MTDHRSRTGRRPDFALAALCAVVAVGFRLGPLLLHGSLRGIIGNDDGVYLSAVIALWHGEMPYRDYVYLHPPGLIAAMALPVRAFWSADDSTLLAVVRLITIAVGAVNVALVFALLRRWGRPAAVVAALSYAVWPAIVGSERTMFLDAYTTLGLLISLLAMRRSGRRFLIVSGAAIGFALTFKLWAGVYVVVLGPMVLARRGIRDALIWTTSAAVAFGIVAGPFVIAAPRAMFHDILAVQLERPALPESRLDRIAELLPSGHWIGAPHGLLTVLGILGVVAVAFPLASALIRRPSEWTDPVWWSILALAQLLFLGWAGTFYWHYAPFVAVTFCLLIGPAFGAIAARGRALHGAAWIVAMLALTLMASEARTYRPGFGVERPRLAAFLRDHPCTWVRFPSQVAVGNDLRRLIDSDCEFVIDTFGTGLAVDAAARDGQKPPFGFGADWQADIRTQLADSDAVVLYADRSGWGFSSETAAFLTDHFRPAENVNGLVLWTPNSSASPGG